jgi:hypothetical protein
MTNEAYRQQYLKWHEAYQIMAFRVFRNAVKESFAGLNVNNITYDNYKIVVPLNVHAEPIRRAYIEVYRSVGVMHGRRVGLGINREIKRFNNDLFSRFFQNNLTDWIRENVGSRIVSVSETVAKRIGRLVEVASQNGLSVDEMQKYLRKRLDDPNFTKYQAIRIARTEVGGAANHAATVAAENSGIVLEKVWIATKDKRTRRHPKDQYDHMHMDGKTVDLYEKFVLRSKGGTADKLLTPCDPKGQAGDVINCRCVVAHRPKRDENGFVITK